ncbi:MAG TPA: hypothetical protein VKU19_18475 [Bryobacteraceae bacterium]|nr:hypothetical protein [Bryobacteraceae bacterium]
MKRPILSLALLIALATAIPAADVRKAISGTVSDFKVNSLEIGVQSDDGQAIYFPIGPETQVVQVPPGERDLSKAKPARITDLSRGDRILVSFVSGLTEARRIVWISATDIAARNAAERLDWQKRGIAGVVMGKEGNEVTLEIRSPLGAETTTLVVDAKTVIRRYAPDSVSFLDALPSTVEAISKGDQVRCRGNRSEDGKRLTAEDIVFGTFLTKVGTVTSIDLAARTVHIADSTNQQEIAVHLNASSQVKMLPDVKTMFINMLKANGASHDTHASEPPQKTMDFGSIMAQLPAGKLEELKAGSMVIVTSTAGARSNEITAILLMANADGLIKMARMQAQGGEGMSAAEAISTLHGGMLTGPGGLNIPTIIP